MNLPSCFSQQSQNPALCLVTQLGIPNPTPRGRGSLGGPQEATAKGRRSRAHHPQKVGGSTLPEESVLRFAACASPQTAGSPTCGAAPRPISWIPCTSKTSTPNPFPLSEAPGTPHWLLNGNKNGRQYRLVPMN